MFLVAAFMCWFCCGVGYHLDSNLVLMAGKGLAAAHRNVRVRHVDSFSDSDEVFFRLY